MVEQHALRPPAELIQPGGRGKPQPGGLQRGEDQAKAEHFDLDASSNPKFTVEETVESSGSSFTHLSVPICPSFTQTVLFSFCPCNPLSRLPPLYHSTADPDIYPPNIHLSIITFLLPFFFPLICPFISLWSSVHQFIKQPINLSFIYSSGYLSFIHISVHLFIPQSITHPAIHPSTILSIHLILCLSAYLMFPSFSTPPLFKPCPPLMSLK